ncbi:hypothetical protein GCM10027614_81280 [Micromonospora vulcania]
MNGFTYPVRLRGAAVAGAATAMSRDVPVRAVASRLSRRDGPGRSMAGFLLRRRARGWLLTSLSSNDVD